MVCRITPVAGVLLVRGGGSGILVSLLLLPFVPPIRGIRIRLLFYKRLFIFTKFPFLERLLFIFTLPNPIVRVAVVVLLVILCHPVAVGLLVTTAIAG